MPQSIGELFLENGKPLLKMWSIDVPAGHRPFVKHSHSRFEITVVNSGSGEYTTEKAVYPMLPGDVFVFSSNEVHCITKAGEQGLSITNLHFEPRYLASKSQAESNVSFMELCFSHAPEFQNRIPGEQAQVIRQNHEHIKQEFAKNDELLPTAIKSYLYLILIDLLRNRHYRLSDINSRIYDMLSVYDYIEQHLCEEITLSQLADIVSLTPNYFSYVFKKTNGISPWKYINAKRIEKAAWLIVSDNEKLTMLEIAARCGFNNTANFNKIFKQMKGFTPTQLKKHPELLFH